MLFGLRGRVSRRVYWLTYLLITCLQSAVIVQLIGGEAASLHRITTAVGPVLLFGTLYSQLAVSVKRLHDCGYTGFFALALLVPLVNLAFTIWAGIVPGTPGPNRLGVATDVPPT